MYKLIASDMDETFIGHDKTVHPGNLEAARRLQEQGGHFVVATGRPFYSVQGTLAQVGTAGDPSEVTIALNGGTVYRNDGTLIVGHPLSGDAARALLEQAQQRELCAHVYLGDRTLVTNVTEAERAFVDGRMEIVETGWEEAFSAIDVEPVYKVLFHDLDVPFLRAVEAELRCDLPELLATLETSYSSERYLEFNPLGVGKGSGLLEAANALGVGVEETVAVGDSLNDLSMLEDAGLSLVVSNVSEGLEAVLPEKVQRLESSCDDAAIAEVVDRFFTTCI